MPRWRRLTIAVFLVTLGSPWLATRANARPSVADAALEAIESRVLSGEVSSEQALLLAVQRVLDPQLLPADLRSLANRPLRCGTPIMQEVARRLPSLGTTVRRDIEALMHPTTLKKGVSTYLSPSGRFVISYDTIGTNGVSAEDIAPANGVPDYVERVALYFDESWTREVTELGFVAPDLQGQPYDVSFEAMGAYGYATLSASSPGGTRIVMHNSFNGFPPNDDPQGNALGAAKVTAAHELKHAVQFATSQWQENGFWPELDATWAEDIVYDQVNDYYNYLPTGSPIAAPSTSLDANGGGSYEDSVFQHWISETWGDSTIVQLWARRATLPTEPMLDSYEWLFQQMGTSFATSWATFATWNYATGARALTGFGYQEASAYPSSTVAANFSALPANHAGVVGHLAANFSEYVGFSSEPGTISIRVQRQFPSSLSLTAIVIAQSGGWTVHPLVLLSGDDTVSLPEPLYSVAKVVIVAGNGNMAGGSDAFTVHLDETVVLPVPVAQVDAANISFTVAAGDSAGRVMSLRNTGAAGSILNYQTYGMVAVPPSTEVAQDVTGSTLVVAASGYAPGTTVDLFFSVTNNTPDLEWLAGIDIAFPAGVRVDSTTAFVGGGAGDLVSNGAVGDSVTVLWVDANGSWGNIKNGETATAHVYVTFDPTLFGDIGLQWTIRGDGYGGGNHTISNSLTLSGPANPSFKLVAPVVTERFALGSAVSIEWLAVGEPKVRLELSRNGGATWETLTDSTANNGQWTWTSAGTSTASARIRVSSLDGRRTDISAQSFWLYEPIPWLAVNPPLGAVTSGTEVSVGLGFDARGLGAGNYAGVLFLEHNGPQGFVAIPIQLQVRSTATPNSPVASAIVLYGNQPNPFNPATKIHFELGVAQRVTLDVYNSAGRHVRRLVDANLIAGDHYVDWRSDDSRGRRVSSGTYYYTLHTASGIERGKMTLVK